MRDLGRYFDALGPYSPYRPIDHMKMTDGWFDFVTHLCPHRIFCSCCHRTDVLMVEEEPVVQYRIDSP
jgi:hypothetical protein